MMTTELKDFCNRWLEKADSQNENKLNDIFDKFVALFIVYNALYSKVTEKLVHSRDITNKQDIKSDRFGATKVIPKYLTHKELARRLREDVDVSVAIEKIVGCVDAEYKAEKINFDICFSFDSSIGKFKRDEKEQSDLVKNARNNNEELSTVAWLEIIYNIRCNMFHGRKNPVEQQKYLIVPTIIVLRKIIELTLDKLEKP